VALVTYVFYVDEGDEPTVWYPVSHAGALYVGMINVVAEVYQVPTGLRAVADDTHAIDPGQFEVFVRRAMSLFTSTNNGEITLLLEGVLPPSTVLLERCGRPLTPQNDDELAIVERGRALQMLR
jgi:hypothetical protein